ncbi:MAG TPA: aminotransferase class V-fold PLP-dependent enzyme, partial [Polyangiaceae bacterium]|nr:aminotransferase class V-fold PLP-dependent enzyme [Polyangiaceae bacterium]
ERREFFGLLAATSALAATTLGCQAAASQAAATAGPPGDEWSAVRAEFNLSPDYIHLAGFLLASHPRRVREAIEQHRTALDANPALYLEEHFDPKAVLGSAAAYLGVKPEEIALTDSTTMGLAILYAGLPLRDGDEVLTTSHDHYATHETLRLATLRAGATLRKVALYERAAEATAEAMTTAIQRALSPKTRVVAITWVHSSTGVRTPVRAIADVIAQANRARDPEQRILLCVDGVHGLGIEDVTLSDLGCDFFAAGTHKWLFGPRGTGVLWGRAELWPRLRPIIPHFGPAAYEAWMKGVAPPPTSADMMTPGGFHSFEHRWALNEAFEFHRAIGKRKVAARIHELNRQCKEGLAQLKNVQLHTPLSDDLSSGIITFEVSGLSPEEVVKRLLDKHIVASHTPYAVSYARLAPGLLNSPQDVERALTEIRALAGKA